MRRTVFTFISMLLICMVGYAQLSLTTDGVPVTEDFTGYNGSGFTPTPAPGQLDSDNWAATGLNDGILDFGGTQTGNDFGKGTTTGGVISGGFYAYDDGLNQAFWIQPTGSDWEPGTITLRLQNNTGSTVTELDIAYDILILNNGDRANSFNLSFSLDNVSYTNLSGADFTSDEIADSLGLGVVTVARAETISALNVADGDFIYIRWSGAEVSGGGSRDEFGLDNISATPTTGAAVSAVDFTATGISANEGDGSMAVSVDISISDNCSVDVVLTGGTATLGSDFLYSSPTTLTFTSGGATTQSVTLNLNDDSDLEADETVELELQNVTGGCLIGAFSAATVTISDNDVAPLGECENLYFSEYIEGSSNNKALEIYNPTDNSVDLSGYSVQAFNNGGVTVTNQLNPIGLLAPGDVYVIANSAADSVILAVADTTSTVTFYNGNDAIVLLNGGDTIDVIGRVGEDPGADDWPIFDGMDTIGFTGENTLVRRPEVKQGQKDWSVGATEWLVFATDDFTNIGSHTQDACADACDASTAPQNLASTLTGGGYILSWDPVANSLGCQVSIDLPTGANIKKTVVSPEASSFTVPLAPISGFIGQDITWKVRCACQVSPSLIVTPFSVLDTFTVGSLREAEELTMHIDLYPNPASEEIFVSYSSDKLSDVNFTVVNLLGQILDNHVVSLDAGTNNIRFDVSNLENGIYFIQSDNGMESVTERFSIAR